MNKPNYEYIGRCTVLERRINNKIEKLRNVKMAVSLSESSYFLNGALVLDHSAADCIEEAASQYRKLMVEITEMAREYNEYAPSAGLDVIDVFTHGIQENNKKAAASANAAAGTKLNPRWIEKGNAECLKQINEADS
ncbi:hypothetical protein AAE374_000621 [Salmonella enterica]